MMSMYGDMKMGTILLNSKMLRDIESQAVLDLSIRKPDTPPPEDIAQNTICLSPGSNGSEYSESSVECNNNDFPKLKLPRPFKAYPKDPLTATLNLSETMLRKDSSESYGDFRQKMLSQVHQQNQGTNIKMRRNNASGMNVTQAADPTYWEKRRKNNEAAKRSRDARRAKEDEIAIRCAFLEQENLKLKYEVTALRNEIERARTTLYH